MTEKRFTTRNGVFYTDNETGWEFECYGEVVELMNKLADENKTFREALKELKEIGDYQAMRIQELQKENTKLKKQISTNNCDNCKHSKLIHSEVECRIKGYTDWQNNCEAFENEI